MDKAIRQGAVIILFPVLLVWGLFALDERAQAQDLGAVRVQLILTSEDVANTSFNYCNTTTPENGLNCATGTGDEDGWVTSNGVSPKAIQVEVDTINATSLDFVIQGRLTGAENQAAQIWPASGDHSVTTTGSFIVQVPDWVSQVRVGYKVTGDAGAQDVDIVYNQFGSRR